jgi:hypothetical protein
MNNIDDLQECQQTSLLDVHGANFLINSSYIKQVYVINHIMLKFVYTFGIGYSCFRL